MTQQPRKKKFSFAIASLFEGAQNITYFDQQGNPIRNPARAEKKKSKHNPSSSQTSLL